MDDRVQSPFEVWLHKEVQKMRDAEFEESHQITLGYLIDLLKAEPEDANVIFDFGSEYNPGFFTSYRGLYNELALTYSPVGSKCSVKTLYGMALNAVGETFTGWKGGDYVMSWDTPVWVSNRGEAEGRMIIGVTGLMPGLTQAVVIRTTIEED